MVIGFGTMYPPDLISMLPSRSCLAALFPAKVTPRIQSFGPFEFLIPAERNSGLEGRAFPPLSGPWARVMAEDKIPAGDCFHQTCNPYASSGDEHLLGAWWLFLPLSRWAGCKSTDRY